MRGNVLRIPGSFSGGHKEGTPDGKGGPSTTACQTPCHTSLISGPITYHTCTWTLASAATVKVKINEAGSV